MSNPKRGELSLTMGSETYHCKLNMDTIMRMEQNCGRGILTIANGLSKAEMSASDMIAILTPVLRSRGLDLKDRDVGKLIFEAGFTEGLRCIAEVIAFLIGGEEEGNVEAAE